MSAFDDVFGLDFYLVNKHVRKLLCIERLELRRAYLRGVGLDDGQRVHDLTQEVLRERWPKPQAQPEGPCAST